MGLEGTPLWSTIDAIVRSEGLQLFDLDLPSDTRRAGALRVFITRPKTSDATGPGKIVPAPAESTEEGSEETRGGVSFDDCARVSKRILDLDEQRELIPGNCTLEVSSPGINRNLRLLEHFREAVGERVKVKYRNTEYGATVVLYGTVREVSNQSMLVEGEGKKEMVKILLSEIKEARVDFKF